MRIVVSGTHASGKSTLISDFAAAHRRFEVMPDPFELLDESTASSDLRAFLLQLQVTAERLLEGGTDDDVIAERAPLDLLAYIVAGSELGRGTPSRSVFERARDLTTTAMRRVDLLAVLPLNSADRIWVPADEDLELRDAMNDALLELSEDTDLLGPRTQVVEITGDPGHRLSLLESAAGALQRYDPAP